MGIFAPDGPTRLAFRAAIRSNSAVFGGLSMKFGSQLLVAFAFVATAYEFDHQFGLLTNTLAVTGARPSQAVRLRVEDLHDHPSKPKLMMPKSAKGGGRNRSQKKVERFSGELVSLSTISRPSKASRA